MEKKLQLVNAPLSRNYFASSKAGAYPPLTLLTLATYIKNKIPDINIEILDGEIISIEEILAKVDADFVGISAGILNYDTAIEIAEIASLKGSKVIMGGPYPTVIPDLILKNHEFIDAVVIGDGEESLFKYMTEKNLNKVPNLAYRKNGTIAINKQIPTPLEAVPITSYEFIELQPYFKNFQIRYPFKPFSGTLSIFSSKGCLWREKSGGCIYCGLPILNYRSKSPEIFWNELKNLYEKYDVNFFWDVSDTFTRPAKRLKEIAKFKPKNLDIKFLFYGRSDDINDTTASLLKNIGAYEIFLGVESGDNRILQLANRGQNSNHILKAVRILAKYGIKNLISFQFGLPGENQESCNNSIKLAKELLETGNVSEVFSSTLLPIPGTAAFNMLIQYRDIYDKYKNSDILPLEELRKDFIKKFCSADYEHISQVRDEILRMFLLSSSLGKPIYRG